jgi:hypothetical protein
VPTLLIVHHTPSPALHAMFNAAMSGATDHRIEGVEVVARPALGATVFDVLGADGYVLGTPANLGYMSGALKHFFDQIYYPCLAATTRRTYGLYVHGNSDTAGAVKAVEVITTGLKWRRAQGPVTVVGEPRQHDLEACWELGAAPRLVSPWTVERTNKRPIVARTWQYLPFRWHQMTPEAGARLPHRAHDCRVARDERVASYQLRIRQGSDREALAHGLGETNSPKLLGVDVDNLSMASWF